MNKLTKCALVAIVSLAMLVNMGVTVKAAKYSYTTATHTTSSEYRSVSFATKTDSLDLYTKQTRRYSYQKGNNWYTDEKPISANYSHTYGQSDLHANSVISKTHTFSTSTNRTITGDFGASLGYEYSETSEKGIVMDIAPSRSTGYYYVGVRSRMIDLRVIENIFIYETYGSYAELKSISTTYVTGVRLYDGDKDLSPLYYAWYKV